MADAAEPVLEFQNASVRFGDVWGLRNVSLSLRPGQTHVFFGSAGSGKTTLLKAAIGLICLDSGRVRLLGQDVTKLREHDFYPLRARTGVLFQEGGLFDSLTVGENVEYPLQNQQQDGASSGNADARVREALRFVELEHTLNQFPSELSGGMRRRVGIARASVTDPVLILYDSPTAGLDPITANTIMALIAKQRDTQSTASLVVTHRYQDGEIMSNFRYDPATSELVPAGGPTGTTFIVMREGEIVFSGSREELEASSDAYVRRFIRHEG